MADNLQGPVLNVSEVKAIEQNLIANGTPAAALMDRAGFAVAQAVADRFEGGMEDLLTYGIVIFAGKGNNGGDGWVAAMYLSDVGFPVTLFSPVAPQDIAVEPARSAAMMLAASETDVHIVVDPTNEEVANAVSTAQVIVDAMVGIGFTGDDLEAPYSTWVRAINAAKNYKKELLVVAVDTPSGLNAQTGAAAQTCVKADATVTMLAYKTGLVTEEAKPYTGVVGLAPLIPQQVPSA